MRRLLASLCVACGVLLSLSGVGSAQSAPTFKLGFLALADQIPEVAGQPLENEHWGDNGDSLQQTTTGLMAWRKADNWTAFTNGSRTWVNGPYGVQSRLNSERFSWEKDSTAAPPAIPIPAAIPSATGSCDAELKRIAAENAADYQAYTKRVLEVDEWNRNLPIKQAELDRLALADQRARQALQIAALNAQLQQSMESIDRGVAAGVAPSALAWKTMVADPQARIAAILAEPPAKGPQLQAIQPPQAPTPKTVDLTKC